jgi:hypothetical protein
MPLFTWILDVERAMWRILGDKHCLYLSYGYFQGRLYDTPLNFELPSRASTESKSRSTSNGLKSYTPMS